MLATSRYGFSALLAILLSVAAARAQGVVDAGVGTNGNIANAGTGLLGGGTGNVAQVGGCDQGLVAVRLCAVIWRLEHPVGDSSDPGRAG